MPIIKDSTPITAVRHRTAAGSETRVLQVIHVTAGGVQTPVFGAQVTTPSIQTNTSLTHNTVVFRVRNTYDLGVTLTVSVRTTGGTVIDTKSLFAEAAGIGGYDPQFTFTGLTSAQSYIIRAIGTLSGHADSQAHELNFTTPVVYTTTPTISNVSQTWNTISWRLTNADTAAATITTALFAADQNTQIGTTKTISLASGAFYDFSQNSLSYSTNYYIKRTAHASADGKLQPSYTISGPYTTATQPQTPTPTVVLVSKTSRSIKVKIANNGTESATIYYRVGESGSWITYGTVASETYTADINLTATATGTNFVPSTSYTIYAKALITGWAESAYDSETVTTNRVLVAPTIVYGSVTGTSISWYVRNDDALTVDMGSNVDSTSSWPYYDNLVPYNTNSTLFTKTGLTSGLTYTVYAQAIDTTGTYDSSGIVELSMTTTPTAATPTLTNTSKTSTSLTFSIKNNDDSAGSYYWYLSDGTQSGGPVSIGAGATLSFTISGLSPSTSYQTVAYVAVSGKVSSTSTAVTTSTNATPVTVTPTNTNITSTTSSISWQVRNNDPSTATIYSKIDGFGDQSKTVNGGSTLSGVFTQSGLNSSTTYYIRSWAVVPGQIDSDFGGAITAATTQAAPVYYTVRWYGYEGDVIKSQTYVSGDTCTSAHYPSNPSFGCRTFTGWSKAAGFAVYQNWNITSNWSNSKPNAPASCTGSRPFANALSFSWSSSTCATSYTYEYKRSTSSTWITGSTTGTSSGTITGLTPGTYNIRVKASNGGVFSGYRNGANVTV